MRQASRNQASHVPAIELSGKPLRGTCFGHYSVPELASPQMAVENSPAPAEEQRPTRRSTSPSWAACIFQAGDFENWAPPAFPKIRHDKPARGLIAPSKKEAGETAVVTLRIPEIGQKPDRLCRSCVPGPLPEARAQRARAVRMWVMSTVRGISGATCRALRPATVDETCRSMQQSSFQEQNRVPRCAPMAFLLSDGNLR